MVLLFNHTCFARYPHFQIAELQTGKKLTQNSLSAHTTKCALHPDGNHTTADCKKLRQIQLQTSTTGGRGSNRGKGKGKGKASVLRGKTRLTPQLPTPKGEKGKENNFTLEPVNPSLPAPAVIAA